MDQDEATNAAEPAGARPTASRRWRWLAIGAVLLVGVIGSGGIWWHGRDSTPELPCPTPIADQRIANCVAAIKLPDDARPGFTSPIALAANGTLAFVNTMRAGAEAPVVIGVATSGNHPTWRLPLPKSDPARYVAIAPAGDRVAVWTMHPKAIRVLSAPSGTPVADTSLMDPKTDARLQPGPDFDMVFSTAGDALFYGNVRQSARLDLAPPATSVQVSDFHEKRECSGMVGQSNIGRVFSHDRKLFVEAPRRGQYTDGLGRCRIESVLTLDRPEPGFLSFSPDDRRLAAVYVGDATTLVEVLDTENRAGPVSVLARITLSGGVGYRVGWSPDGKRLALITDVGMGGEARLYAIP